MKLSDLKKYVAGVERAGDESARVRLVKGDREVVFQAPCTAADWSEGSPSSDWLRLALSRWREETAGAAVGPALVAARGRAGLTQKAAAERIGITPQTLMQYEKGLRLPTVGMLIKICDGLGADPADVVRRVTDFSSVE